MTDGLELFEVSDAEELALLCVPFLTGEMAALRQNERETVLAVTDQAGPLRQAMQMVQTNSSFLDRELLGYLCNSRSRWCE